MFLKDVLEEKVFLDGGRNKEYFILSFSKCRDSITMWSEFGNKTGYNIGFDGKKIIKRIEEDNIIEYHGFATLFLLKNFSIPIKVKRKNKGKGIIPCFTILS